jgi:hypothetical protein
MTDQLPSVGRIVHYVAYGTPGGEFPASSSGAVSGPSVAGCRGPAPNPGRRRPRRRLMPAGEWLTSSEEFQIQPVRAEEFSAAASSRGAPSVAGPACGPDAVLTIPWVGSAAA